MKAAWGIVTQGHRVASGLCDDPRFPVGTIRPQLPFFAEAVVGFADYLGGEPYPGTINVSFPGCRVEILQPEHQLRGIAWTPVFSAEDFYLSPCILAHVGEEVPGYLYIPSPATKPDHPANPSVVEVLCRRVEGIAYGDTVTLLYHPKAIAIVDDLAAKSWSAR